MQLTRTLSNHIASCLLPLLALLVAQTVAAAPTVGPLTASPSSIQPGQSTSVTVTVVISAATPSAGGVNLLQEDGSGNTLSILGVMHDDGLNGDAVAGDGTYTLVVPFIPTAQTTAIYVQASAAFQGALQRVKSSVIAIGVATQTSTLTISPTSLNFPVQTIGTTSAAQTLSLLSSGNQPVAISSITTSGDFAISSNACPASLAVSTTCTLSVAFTPTSVGPRQSSVIITDNASGSPQAIALSGTGQIIGIPTITISPNALTFPVQNVGSTSSPQSFVIMNSGNLPALISSITTSGDFAISSNACPPSLAAGTNCTVSITFTPTAVGSRQSSVIVTDNAGGSPQSVALSGTGQTISVPTVTISPTSLTFPAQNVGSTSSAQSFSVINSGTQAVTFSSITTTADFAITSNTCPTTLATGANCAISITFTPTGTGPRSSSVVITDNATGSPQSVALSGTGQQAITPTITINPTSLTFPGQDIKTTSAAQSFTLTNSGGQPLTISSITTAGDFAIASNTCPTTLAIATSCTISVVFTPTTTGTRTSSVVITDNATGSPQSIALSGTGQQPTGAYTITSFGPATGSIGTLVKVVLNNFTPGQGTAPIVTLPSLQGGSISAPVSAFSQNALSFVIPPGAGTGAFTIALSGQSATSANPLTVTTSSGFTLTVGPGTANLIVGQSITYAVTVNSSNGFDGLATLSVSGVPTGVQASFKPQAITAGQTAVLTLTAPASQSRSAAALSFSASATIDGQNVSQTATASLNVTAVTTTFLGRTVVDDAQETPIGGVTVRFLGKDAQGNSTGCSGQTASDTSGNFALTNLAASCVGPQLISYDGTTATSPAGKYAGVNLSYTLVSGQVTASPVLVHLPRIDKAETVQVQQNSRTDQVFTFSSIPGLQVTVYAGTTIALADGSLPNPFPLTALDIPLDRLPEQTPTNGMLMNFVVAFQPANATASQPVAVTFPNPLNMAPLSTAALTTLDPTRGFMVPYGTTTVASDGRTFIPDLDPAHPGHRYGLVHFDWHTPLANLLSLLGLGPENCQTCNPVDLSSGIETYTTTDLQVRGGRGSMAIQRTYRTLSTNPGPFGIGTGLNYSVALNLTSYLKGQAALLLLMPNGNQYTLSAAADGTFLNATIPTLRGTVLTPDSASGVYTMRQQNGTVYTFQTVAGGGSFGAYLTSIKDLNGNITTLTLNPSQPLQVLKVTDPVGRSMNLTYDGANRITQIADPIGRTVKYTYNAQGTLETFTDANGGVTKYTYNSTNSVVTITDARGVVTETNSYNEAGDGRVTQQVDANGGVTKFAYTLLNPAAALVKITAGGASPVLQTVLTDPLGNQTIYRFNPAGFLQSATDPSGQTTTLTHDGAHNNLITAYQGAGVCVICGNRATGDTSYTYDQFGNRLTRTDALGHTTTFTYDLRFNKINSITDPIGNSTRLAYDGDGNLLNITDANGHQTQLSYDAFGEVTQVTDAIGSKTTVNYDSFGNVTSITDALGHATALSYDAVSRLTQVADALGRKSTAAYDKLDRVSSQTDPRGSTTSFAYDSIGDLLSFTDPRNNSVTFAYDPMGRLGSRTSQLGKVESYQYDANSNAVQHTDRRGQISKFQYDVNNRLLQETYSDATVTRNYDTTGRLLTVNDSQGGTFAFVYDSTGQLLTQGEPTGTVQYARDALGRVSTRQVAGQGAVNYTYDPIGNMLSAALPPIGVSYQYDARNLPASLSRSNGVTTNYSYDQLGRVLSIFHSRGTTALNTQSYNYDSVGNRSMISNDISQSLITPAAASSVDQANELLTNGQSTYTYDANGNRLAEMNATGTLSYSWDSRNRLSAITDATGKTTSLRYDFTRNLLLIANTTGNIAQKSFVVDSLANVASLTDASGASISVVTGRDVDSHYASLSSSGVATFGLGDTSGSNNAVTDASGAIISRLFYEPYGQTSGTIPATYPFTFTGRVPVFANLIYYRNRFYDAAVGRFISEDPLSDLFSSNAHLAFDDNPVNEIDPSGLVSVFGFGGYHDSKKLLGFDAGIATAEIEGEREVVGIGGYDFSSGCKFGGAIGAIGISAKAGAEGEEISGETLRGQETIGGKTQSITLVDGQFGINKVIDAGGGSYVTGGGEQGVYFFLGIGKHGSIGFGFSFPEFISAFLQNRPQHQNSTQSGCGCSR